MSVCASVTVEAPYVPPTPPPDIYITEVYFTKAGVRVYSVIQGDVIVVHAALSNRSTSSGQVMVALTQDGYTTQTLSATLVGYGTGEVTYNITTSAKGIIEVCADIISQKLV